MPFNLDINNDNQTGSIRVLFITHNYIRFKGDFAGVFLHLLARKLKENGVEVIVVAPHDAATAESEIIDGIRIYRFRYAKEHSETFAYRGDMHRQLFRNPFRVFRLIKFLKSAYKLASSIIEKERINVVSIQWMIPNGMVGYFLKRKYEEKIKLYLSSHGTDIRLLTKFPLIYSFFNPVIKRAKGWTVVSNHLREQILIRDKNIEDKVKVIPLPNDESLFYPDPQIHKEPTLVVAVSRLTIQKRLSLLLEAVKTVSAEVPEIRLEIYGAGPEKIRLMRQISEFGLEGRAAIHDPVPQEKLRDAYNRAGVVVLNSAGEGFGLALTEAMLCRTAVIGTISGGITDIIDDRKTGLLVPPDDVLRLAEAIEEIIQDRVLRASLAEAGYQKALARFSSDSSARRFAELYRGK